jgi:Rps23 Pro-64 3,4-dihydroxylase Tpa1-like proline 4-hydroxylase
MKKIQLRDFSPNTRQIQKQSVSSRRKSPILGSRATTPLKSPPTINSRSEEHDSPVFEMKIDDPNNFAEQTTSSTKVHDQHISKQDPDIAFSVEPGIVAVIHIAALNGNTMDIIVRENDSPQYLAESFVSIHGLNKLLVPTLVKEIEKSVINAQKQADITPGDQQNKVGNSSTANGQNIDNIKSESSPSVEDILQVPSEIVIKRSLSPFDHVESFVSGNHYDAEIDTFSQSSPLTEEFTHSDYSIGKFSNNNTPLIPREIPQSEDFSSSQHRYLHTNVYDRLYGHAVVMHTRKEHLKEQLEEERYQQILSTSFRYVFTLRYI